MTNEKLIVNPDEIFNVITIQGHKFIQMKDSFMQCATCLSQPSVYGYQKLEKGKVRKLVIEKNCDCPKQNG